MAKAPLSVFLFDDSKDRCIFVSESSDVYSDYFAVKNSLGKKKYLAYDYLAGGYYPNALAAESKIRLNSLEDTIKHFYLNNYSDILILAVDSYELDSNVLTLLRYFKSAPKTTKKNIAIIIKSASQLEGLATVVNKVRTLRYLTDLKLDTKVVGLNNLRGWLNNRKVLVTGAHPVPLKGISILGVPGVGKTIAAQLAAEVLELPAYKFNLHTCLGKYVGDSENNTELAFREIESLGKCVILLDEVDKIFNRNDDNQTTSRVLSILLNYMQLNEDVFWVLTGNNIDEIPPELLRKGRLDEYFYIGLPEYEAVCEYILSRLLEFSGYRKINDIEVERACLAQYAFNKELVFSDIVSLCNDYYIFSITYNTTDAHKFLENTKPISSYKRYEQEYGAILKWSEKNAKSAI